MRRSLPKIGLLASVASLICTGPAWAYLDPGTGSMMLQLLLGGIAGAMVVGKLYWHRFRGFLTSRFSGRPRDSVRARHASASAGSDVPDE